MTRQNTHKNLQEKAFAIFALQSHAGNVQTKARKSTKILIN